MSTLLQKLFKRSPQDKSPDVPVETGEIPRMVTPAAMDIDKRQSDLERIKQAENKRKEVQAEGAALLNQTQPKRETNQNSFGYIANPFRE